jgi:hypothetical protein
MVLKGPGTFLLWTLLTGALAVSAQAGESPSLKSELLRLAHDWEHVKLQVIVAREPLFLLAALRLGNSCEAFDPGRRNRTTSDLANGHRLRPWRAQLYGSGAYTGQRRRG